MLREEEKSMNLQRMRRLWYQQHGEQPLLTVFWPRDYPIGSVQEIDRHPYKITRYMRSVRLRFFEVWGREV